MIGLTMEGLRKLSRVPQNKHKCSGICYGKKPVCRRIRIQLSGIAAEVGQETLRGRYLALFQLSWSVAGLLAPGLFALLFTLHPILPWLVMVALLLLASLTIYWIEPHLPRRAVRRP